MTLHLRYYLGDMLEDLARVLDDDADRTRMRLGAIRERNAGNPDGEVRELLREIAGVCLVHARAE